MRYANEKCPVCLDLFKDGDDIVVCSECGTPHHRECWKKSNICGNSQRHAEGFIWQPENSSSEEPKFDQNRQLGIICSVCGTNCPPDVNSCPVCSTPLNKPHAFQSTQQFGRDEIEFRPPFDSQQKMLFDNLPFSPDTVIDSFSAKDASFYIQVNSKRYITKFMRNKKLSWNWGAFFFAPYWFLFRKLYKLGIVLVSIFLALSILTTVTVDGKFDTFMSLAEKVGDTSDISSWSQEQQEEYLSLFSDLMKVFTPFIAANLLLRIACALSANSIYRKKVGEDINILRSRSDNEKEFIYHLIEKGGVSAIAAIAGFIASDALQKVILRFIL